MVENLQAFYVNTAFACAVGVGVVVSAYGISRGAKLLVRNARKLAAVSLLGAVLIGGMVVVGTDDAGTKPSTNDVTQVEGGTNVLGGVIQGRARSPSAPQRVANGESNGPALRRVRRTRPTGMDSITDDDITQGWRVISVSSNALPAATFTMPPNAIVWESAQRCGRGWGSWKIPVGGWYFPFGDKGWTNAFVWAEGYFRSRFNSRANEITILSERMALCPAANWSRYNLPASRAWSMTNGVGGLVTTFENAAVGDDPAKIVSAQLELLPQSGRVALRYDLHTVGDAQYEVGVTANGTNHFVTVGSNTSEVVFQRIHPDDWDFDGLPNALDPNPYQPEANAGFNQSDAWAMFAFPSNATEIAALGYVDWAGLRSFEPNRRQISLRFGSEMNAWPACLTFGDVQVMCDGTEEVFFALDCGAHYAFSMPGCELAGVWLYGVWCTWFGPDWWYGPYEMNQGDVTIHLDTMGSGWIGTTAEVFVDGLDGAHFFPNDSKNVTAVVTNCHEDAYIDCTWSGGDGVTFSNRHSLTTTVSWHSSNPVEWATNFVDLVTTYKGGYAVTNHCAFTVGTQTEPSPGLELTCPTNMFLNSVLYSNYVERVYPASVKVTAPHGARGRLWLDVDANSGIRLYADRERTAGMPDEISVEIPEGGEYGTNVSFFVTCPHLGTGRIQASLFLTDGTEKNAHVDVLVIEPERRLVMDEHDERTGIIVNPSRLVYGTNAVLRVGVHQAGHAFNPMDITWHPISRNCRISPTNGLSVVVEPTTDSGVAVVEARFNDDAVQPRFVLPIVRWRELAVKAFVVQPPEKDKKDAWTEKDINETIAAANSVYSQIGVRFNLQEIVMEGVGTSSDWVLQRSQVVTNGNRKTVVLSNQAANLFDHYKLRDCIELYFVGNIIPSRVLAFRHPCGIAISRRGLKKPFVVAHEIGHALGLEDCYALNKVDVMIGRGDLPVQRGMFSTEGPDWGEETSHGFYGSADSLELMLRSMLMCGNLYGENVGVDIPDDWIESLGAFARSPDQTAHAAVGARTVESKTDAEIYSW